MSDLDMLLYYRSVARDWTEEVVRLLPKLYL